MTETHRAIRRAILQAASDEPEGHVLQAGDFLTLSKGSLASAQRHLATRTLGLLVKNGVLLRIGRGLYVKPVDGRFGKRPPSADRVLASLEVKEGHPIVCSGATAANMLGLSTQIPARAHYLTTGRQRRITLGRLNVDIFRAEGWQVSLRNSRPGLLIRALAAMAEEGAGTYPPLFEPFTIEEWRLVSRVSADLPAWMPRQMERIGRASGF